MPLILARIYEEDIEFESTGKIPPNYRISPHSKISKVVIPEYFGDLSNNIEYRNNALNSSFEKLSL